MTRYFSHIVTTTRSLATGLWTTLLHLLNSYKQKKSIDIRSEGYFKGQQGIATIQYPHEQLPIPDVGRYQLDCEIDDCIVCNQCVRICPVDCIEIDAIRAVEVFGRTSDDSPKRIHAARFDIDMGKCCFCGLCTTVCPTECLTMTPEYAYATSSLEDHTFSFATMGDEEIAIKEKEWATSQALKKGSEKPGEKKQPGV